MENNEQFEEFQDLRLSQAHEHHQDVTGLLDVLIERTSNEEMENSLDVIIEQNDTLVKTIKDQSIVDPLEKITKAIEKIADRNNFIDVEVIKLKGEKGDDGYTPVKGKDYDDGKDGYTPVKGKDYFDGKDGKDADEKLIISEVLSQIPTPKDGKDGKEVDKSFIISEVLSQIPKTKNGIKGKDGKDGSPDSPTDIVKKLESLEREERLDAKAIKNLDNHISNRLFPFSNKSFVNLTDTPETYAGQAGKVVKVKANEDGLEFGVGGGSGSVLLADKYNASTVSGILICSKYNVLAN